MNEVGKNQPPEISGVNMQTTLQTAGKIKSVDPMKALPAVPTKISLTKEQQKQIDDLNEPNNPVNMALINNAKGNTPKGLKEAVGCIADKIFKK